MYSTLIYYVIGMNHLLLFSSLQKPAAPILEYKDTGIEIVRYLFDFNPGDVLDQFWALTIVHNRQSPQKWIEDYRLCPSFAVVCSAL